MLPWWSHSVNLNILLLQYRSIKESTNFPNDFQFLVIFWRERAYIYNSKATCNAQPVHYTTDVMHGLVINGFNLSNIMHNISKSFINILVQLINLLETSWQLHSWLLVWQRYNVLKVYSLFINVGGYMICFLSF